MKNSKLVSVNLTTLMGLMAILLIGVIAIFASIIIYSDYKFNEASNDRSEKVLANSLLTGSMPLAVATQDIELIKTLVHGHLQFNEIFAIEINSADGELLYREEKETGAAQVNIISKTYNLESSGQNVTINNFNAADASEQVVLGKVTIQFSTATLHDKVEDQLRLAVSLVAIAILLCAILILIFNRLFTRQVKQIKDLTETIKSGEKLQERDKPLMVSELDTIDKYLRNMANTIYERDSELTIALNKAVEAKLAAQNAEEFKDEFIRAISHDIKTPLGVVVNLLELINDEAISRDSEPGLTQKISACYKSATILADVTEELFNLEQFQSKELINTQTRTNLVELFSKIEALYQHKFTEKNITFKVQHSNVRAEEIPSTILIDEKKLILIIENVIDNALKFTKDGFVSISWRIANSLHITVRDSGIGIPDDKISSIFEKHRQLGDQKTSRYNGRGLGLYYVKRLLDVMQGQYSVSSKIGIGTVFEITVPFDIVVAPAVLTPSQPSDPIKTLIIDDSELTCFTLTSMLEKMGIESSYECIPEIGYSRLIKETPDLVFIDYHMPNLSGDELANRAKTHLLPHATFFVCITAEPAPEKINALENIFDVVIRKPLKKELIEDVVRFARKSKSVTANFLVEPKDR